jgi:hypothetical protein
MSLNDLLALLSLLLDVLATIATVFAAIFAYQGLKQFKALGEYGKPIRYQHRTDACKLCQHRQIVRSHRRILLDT